jgi:phosphoribosylanthranilate isomerase
MTRPLVKICGNTNIEDARAALEYGADLLGFIFYEKSPRYISPEKAQNIISKLKEDFLFKSVGVLVNPITIHVDTLLGIADLDVLQFHGDEPLSFINSFNKKIIKAFRIKEKSDLIKCDEYENADYFLLDTFSKEVYGGTGKAFDWSLLEEFKFRDRLFLAGGISASNVKEAVAKVKPYAVDLVTSLEKSPGIKDREKIKNFFHTLKSIL